MAGFSAKALEKFMSDQKRAMRVASAFERLQRGKRALDARQDRALHAFAFATRGDYVALGKRLSSLKRRLRELEGKLDRARR